MVKVQRKISDFQQAENLDDNLLKER